MCVNRCVYVCVCVYVEIYVIVKTLYIAYLVFYVHAHTHTHTHSNSNTDKYPHDYFAAALPTIEIIFQKTSKFRLCAIVFNDLGCAATSRSVFLAVVHGIRDASVASSEPYK